jgi:hypothetical protein
MPRFRGYGGLEDLLYLGYAELVRPAELHLDTHVPCGLFRAILHYRGVRIRRDHVGRHLDADVSAAGESGRPSALALLPPTTTGDPEQRRAGDADAPSLEEVPAAKPSLEHRFFAFSFPAHAIASFPAQAIFSSCLCR